MCRFFAGDHRVRASEAPRKATKKLLNLEREQQIRECSENATMKLHMLKDKQIAANLFFFA
jgi:hypothetical protein